jgi:hypothetical protein
MATDAEFQKLLTAIREAAAPAPAPVTELAPEPVKPLHEMSRAEFTAHSKGVWAEYFAQVDARRRPPAISVAREMNRGRD